jgi:hypothetical protein
MIAYYNQTWGRLDFGVETPLAKAEGIWREFQLMQHIMTAQTAATF